jgi:hypothetical protein
MSKFIHITIHFDKGVKGRNLAATFDLAKDWVAYAPGCWFVFTDESERVWLNRLMDATNREATILTCEFDFAKMQGFLPDTIWDWFKKHGMQFRVEFG